MSDNKQLAKKILVSMAKYASETGLYQHHNILDSMNLSNSEMKQAKKMLEDFPSLVSLAEGDKKKGNKKKKSNNTKDQPESVFSTGNWAGLDNSKTLLEECKEKFWFNTEVTLYLLSGIISNITMKGVEYKGKKYYNNVCDCIDEDAYPSEEEGNIFPTSDEIEPLLCSFSIEGIKYIVQDIMEDIFPDDAYINFEEFSDWFYDVLTNRKNEILINDIVFVSNGSGENTDHRGSDHCKVVVPDVDSYLENPTLKEFIKAVLLARSHHFDNWYEMYRKTVCLYKEGLWDVCLVFEHGS